jgi:choline dehydrogenase-like flavoprotein
MGAGAAGAVFAAVLTRAGKKVVVLEHGPDWRLFDLRGASIGVLAFAVGGAEVLLTPSAARAKGVSCAC